MVSDNSSAPGTLTYPAEMLNLEYTLANGQMFRWDTDPAAWVAFACQVAGRNLGADEWREVFGSEPYRKTC